MARARSPNSIEAEEMYKNGMKLVDIAKKLDVPASTVRRWKSTQNWDGKTKGKKNERSQKKKANVRHKGGQPGNRNAVGNKGGPLKPGDKIAEKHGAYSSVYWDVLDESEKDMIEDIPMDEEMLLIEQIQLFAVRERRIMIAINKYRNMKLSIGYQVRSKGTYHAICCIPAHTHHFSDLSGCIVRTFRRCKLFNYTVCIFHTKHLILDFSQSNFSDFV